MSNTRHAYRLAYSRFRLLRNDGVPGSVVSFHANGVGFYGCAGDVVRAPLIAAILADPRPGDHMVALSPHLSPTYRRLVAGHSREFGPVPLPR